MFLAESDRDPLRFGDVARAGIVRGRVVRVFCVGAHHAAPAKHCADVVVPGGESIQPIGAGVVGLVANAHRHQAAGPLERLIAHHLHTRHGHRFAELVDDASGDGCAAGQGEICARHGFVLGELNGPACLEWPPLPET